MRHKPGLHLHGVTDPTAWQGWCMTTDIAIVPDTRPAMHRAFVAAVRDGGGRVAPLADAAAIVWADPSRAEDFPDVVAQAPNVRWVQLPYAGIEPFRDHLDARYTWTCGKGVYAPPVAEHVLALTLAGLRGLVAYGRAHAWSAPEGRNLLGARVAIFGGGGISDAVRTLFAPFGCRFTVVRRNPHGRGSASRDGSSVLGPERALDAVRDADVVILALALTSQTQGLVDATFLAAMQRHAWLINVARGAHVVTDDLVRALHTGTIAGAALDVTDPEPLPAGHPLWDLPNCIITPHVANTPEMGLPLIAARVRDNVARFVRGEPLLGLVDVAAGY
jgi:phosphoglycerate dehydrogenase-like enzyme